MKQIIGFLLIILGLFILIFFAIIIFKYGMMTVFQFNFAKETGIGTFAIAILALRAGIFLCNK